MSTSLFWTPKRGESIDIDVIDPQNDRDKLDLCITLGQDELFVSGNLMALRNLGSRIVAVCEKYEAAEMPEVVAYSGDE